MDQWNARCHGFQIHSICVVFEIPTELTLDTSSWEQYFRSFDQILWVTMPLKRFTSLCDSSSYINPQKFGATNFRTKKCPKFYNAETNFVLQALNGMKTILRCFFFEYIRCLSNFTSKFSTFQKNCLVFPRLTVFYRRKKFFWTEKIVQNFARNFEKYVRKFFSPNLLKLLGINVSRINSTFNCCLIPFIVNWRIRWRWARPCPLATRLATRVVHSNRRHHHDG